MTRLSICIIRGEEVQYVLTESLDWSGSLSLGTAGQRGSGLGPPCQTITTRTLIGKNTWTWGRKNSAVKLIEEGGSGMLTVW